MAAALFTEPCFKFDFRRNTRVKLGFTDTDRATVALKSIGGKRLTYAARPCAQA